MNNWIPVIVILAVLAGGGYYAYRKIKRKVEDVSQALFGTDSLVEGWNKQADELAAKVGEQIAKVAQEAGVQAVVFDRNGYLYHGRIKELADAARNGGLKF